ncbi:type 2C protein phosphatase PTC1 NDAI_0A07300 [Naumovozyma dairenensis CBS 421]|uniref:PPM-type phosphatase domain-containing protein n=1 Tax=Naumovozyma dairenensis (strain ATCC 10597 / BCRC 20456 / CBS 421 / NBRC 0211 / NRRL Y-12639) TaxID=1071378 RepID=G0W4Z6_NAUDC|nr:hypothetical protein NDAI_0A07300 [Naumovozyma dairenensis CBS 421]CCD22884.1 hypothetical protein NDAI_0A07300 [Naumovozyma dairenensis CBS 421]
MNTQPQEETPESYELSYKIGVAENKIPNFVRRWKMFIHMFKTFASRLDWGYFAIFDGHAGFQASKWCGSNLHSIIEEKLLNNDNEDGSANVDVRDILNESFLIVDKQINTQLEGNSGCTAAVCVLRWELPDDNDNANDNDNGKSTGNADEIQTNTNSNNSKDLRQHKRKLYTANVGDSRIVLFRNGHSIRLTYDHKASDLLEMKRVEEAGGLIMKSRVNGMLAVTRSLGDKFFDSLVISNPFTTSVELIDSDEFLIIACDGLWDVIDDQDACELIQDIKDPKEAAKKLVKYALENGTTDNVTVNGCNVVNIYVCT